jgi:hypothetical protein
MTTCIFPSDSDIEFLGPGTFYCSGVIEQIFPASLKEIHVTNQF